MLICGLLPHSSAAPPYSARRHSCVTTLECCWCYTFAMPKNVSPQAHYIRQLATVTARRGLLPSPSPAGRRPARPPSVLLSRPSGRRRCTGRTGRPCASAQQHKKKLTTPPGRMQASLCMSQQAGPAPALAQESGRSLPGADQMSEMATRGGHVQHGGSQRRKTLNPAARTES